MTNPSNLTAVNQGEDVLLSWDAAVPADGYNLYRDNVLIGTIESSTTFLDTTVFPGISYTWTLIAFGVCGLSAPIYVTITTTCSSPGNIYGITATLLGATSIEIDWTGAINANGYTLTKSINSGGYSPLFVAGPTQTSYIDNIVTPGNTYTYKISAFNNCESGLAEISNTVNPVCLVTYGPPSNLIISAIGTTEATISFDEIILSGGGTPTEYIIQRRLGVGGSYSPIAVITDYATQIPYTDTTLSPDTEYCYNVQASGGICLNTSPSAEQCITTMIPLPCNSMGSTFNWYVQTFAEPGYEPGDDENNLHTSPNGSIDMSDPRIIQVGFAPDSVLDDILILTRSTDTVTMDWDEVPGHPQYFSLPTPCILFANNSGYYINSGTGYPEASCKKTLSQYDSMGNIINQLILPQGNNDIGNLSYDGSGNIILQIVGFRGSASCSSRNGTFTLIKITSVLYQDSVSGWSIRLSGTMGNSNYIWGVYLSTIKMYYADANSNILPPTETYEYFRSSSAGCQNSEGKNGMSYIDLVAAGFDVRSFSTGISKSDLQSLGFLDSNQIFNFKFAHIACGRGGVTISGLTCSDGTNSLCSSPPSPTTLISSVSGSSVSLSWTDNSGGAAATLIERVDNINDLWDIVTLAPAGTTSFIDTPPIGAYAYRASAVIGDCASCYSNSASASVPCDCSIVPTSIQISFRNDTTTPCVNSVNGCPCFSTGSGSANSVVITMDGPYTLTGDGISMVWAGNGGFIEMFCFESPECTGEPTIYTGPVYFHISISGSVLTVQGIFENSCCDGVANVFYATQNILCDGGIYTLDNFLTSTSSCACSESISWETLQSGDWSVFTSDEWESFTADPALLVGNFYGGTIRVEINCN